MDNKVNELIELRSKRWLANQLDISFITLQKRIELKNWKKLEVKHINWLHELYKEEIITNH